MGRRAAVRALDRIVKLSEGSRTASTSSGARVFPSSSTGLFGAQPSAVVAPAAAWTGSKANRSALAQPVEEASPVPDTIVDAYGAVSVVSEEDAEFEDDVYRNIDGRRFEDGRYAAFMNEISAFIPKSRQFTDPVRTFAYGTDASFYRLNPKLVVKVHNEEELQRILPIAEQLAVPVTFRAAGTSLSGQAITDSVLLKLSHTGKNFRNYEIHVSFLPAKSQEPLFNLLSFEITVLSAMQQRFFLFNVPYRSWPLEMPCVCSIVSSGTIAVSCNKSSMSG